MRIWQEFAGVIGVFVLLTAVLTVTIWQLAASWRAKAVLAREDEYRELAAKAVQAQQHTAQQLVELNSQVGELRTRMGSLERILKEVE